MLRKPASKGPLTFQGELYEVGVSVMRWAGVLDVWSEYELGDDYAALDAINVDGAHYTDDVIDDGKPGMTMRCYTYEIYREDDARAKIRKYVRELAIEKGVEEEKIVFTEFDPVEFEKQQLKALGRLVMIASLHRLKPPTDAIN